MVTKNLWIAGCAAAVLAASTGAVRADDSSMTPVPASAYVLLTNTVFNGVDLNQAKAEGFNDSQVATIAKIANKSGMSFGYIKDRVISGSSFGILADEFNLRQKDIWDNKDYKEKIALYKLAWATTGKEALKQKVMASQETYMAPTPVAAMPAPAPMATPTPVTPATPAPAMPDTNTTPAPTPAP